MSLQEFDKKFIIKLINNFNIDWHKITMIMRIIESPCNNIPN